MKNRHLNRKKLFQFGEVLLLLGFFLVIFSLVSFLVVLDFEFFWRLVAFSVFLSGGVLLILGEILIFFAI